MSRLPRLAVAGEAHLVIQPGLAGTPVFVDTADRERFLANLREAMALEGVQLHAFALLAHEVRLLLRPRDAPALSRLMQAVGRRYVSAYNRRHGRRGPLWSGRFRCCPLAPGAAVLEALVWVELARATLDGANDTGVGADPGSGRSEVAGGSGPSEWPPRSPLVTDPPELWALGNTPFERESAYRRLLLEGLPTEVAQRLRSSALGGWAYGLPPEAARAAAAPGWTTATARPLAPRAKGRPRRPG